MNMTEQKWAFPAVLILLSVNFVFYSATLRKGHDWGGDFAMYIHLAENVAEGLPYAQTGYIYNQARPALGPPEYPPVFPLLLAPVYRVFGLNLKAMKLEILLFFEMALYVFWLIAKDELPPILALTAVAVLGFNPYFWQFKDNVLSDVPFLLFTYLCLFLIARYYQSTRTRKQTVAWAVLVGACIYLACGTRTIGLVLLPVLLLHDWVRQRKVGVFSIVATAVCVPLVGLQAILVGASHGYLHMFVFHPRTLLAHGVAYAKSVLWLWNGDYSRWLHVVLFYGMYALAIVGFLKLALRRRLLVYGFFLTLYLGAVLLWPYYQSLRLLIPLLPLYVLYAFCALNDNRQFMRARLEWAAQALLIGLILTSYVGAYSKAHYGPLRTGVGTPQAAAFFNFIKQDTPAKAVFIFYKPRVLSLYTGRSAAACSATSNFSVIWNYIHKIRASYLATSPNDDASYRRFISKYHGDLERVYFNSHFDVYKVRASSPSSGRTHNLTRRRDPT